MTKDMVKFLSDARHVVILCDTFNLPMPTEIIAYNASDEDVTKRGFIPRWGNDGEKSFTDLVGQQRAEACRTKLMVDLYKPVGLRPNGDILIPHGDSPLRVLEELV